jgi:hypothetical protein
MGFYYFVSSVLSAGLVAIGIIAFLPAGFGDDFQLIDNAGCKLISQIRVQFAFGTAYFKLLITMNLTLTDDEPEQQRS